MVSCNPPNKWLEIQRDRVGCLSLFRLLQQNTTKWVAYEQQKFIAHSSGGWKLPSSRCQHGCLLVKAFFLVHSQYLVSVSSYGGKG